MATWQYTLHLLPRKRLIQLFSEIPDSVDRCLFDSTDWWKDQVLCQDYEVRISSFLEESPSWSKSIKAWGQDDGDCISLMIDHEQIVEIEVRIDVRAANATFVENVCGFARLCDCLLLTEDSKLIEPDVGLLRRQIDQSNAAAFVLNPVSFLEGLKNG